MEKIFNVTANVFVVPNSLQFNKKTGEVNLPALVHGR